MDAGGSKGIESSILETGSGTGPFPVWM